MLSSALAPALPVQLSCPLSVSEIPDNHPTVSTLLPRRRPVFVILAVLLIVIGYPLCNEVVGREAVPDFLGIDIGKAIYKSHFPASIVAAGLVIMAYLRRERPLWVLVLLALFAAFWLAFSTYFTLHALPFLCFRHWAL